MHHGAGIFFEPPKAASSPALSLSARFFPRRGRARRPPACHGTRLEAAGADLTPLGAPAGKPRLTVLRWGRLVPKTEQLPKPPTVGACECPSIALRTKYRGCFHLLWQAR